MAGTLCGRVQMLQILQELMTNFMYTSCLILTAKTQFCAAYIIESIRPCINQHLVNAQNYFSIPFFNDASLVV